MLTINNTLDGYLKDIEINGNTIQDADNLADIRSVGEKVEGQELYEIPILCTNGLKDSDSNYQEDKITILSPTPLEKVGDVADRIIEKDGVWGVEKHATTYVINGNEAWNSGSMSQGLYSSWCNNIINNRISTNRICYTSVKYTNSTEEYTSSTEPCCLLYTNGVNIKIGATDLTSFKNKIKGMKLTYLAQTPTFIPLPHDQQVKLRTFANKTNISFLTEIEGTIKAQVPKSLGATVNTHTEQISNLNKELDRVKKLEESTVSTVETESDFTVVEQTSNGYFEDVKLEGKTLVNLVDYSRLPISMDSYVWSKTTNGVGITFTNARDVAWKDSIELKANTTYTIIYDLEVTINQDNNDDGEVSKVGYFVYNKSQKANWYNQYYNSDLLKIGIDSLGVKFTRKVKTKFTTQEESYLGLGATFFNSGVTGVTNFNNLMLLEGDHTQNPPSYFEGLKSVGDDTDEIVVSSCGKNLFKGYNKLIPIKSNTYTLTSSNTQGASRLAFKLYDKQLNVLTTGYSNNGGKTGFYFYSTANRYQLNSDTTTLNEKFTIIGASYIEFIDYLNSNYANCQLEEGTVATDYTPHQSDKKQLLFYNTETQTWEKPVLREWDSIEKHSDGKYYYHQRSEEVLLNGSESWNNDTNGSMTEYRQSIVFNSNSLPNAKSTDAISCVISDSLKSVKFDEVYNAGAIGISLYGTSSVGTTLIINNGFKTATECKEWLQANPVTVVYQLAEEKVYECANIDLITYADETNYIVESGAISPKSTLKVHNNISNVVSLLQKKVSLLESNITNYMITQNRLQLASTYSADSVTFKVDYYAMYNNEAEEYNNDLYDLILNNILVGKDNYDYDKMFNIILDYASWNQISWEQFDILVGLMDMQHNPPIEELPTEDEIEEETPVE